MRAMVLHSIAPMNELDDPLMLVDLPRQVPASGEILVEVAVCGVCHTELDEIEGRTPPPTLPVVPGHEVVGTVAETGGACRRYAVGDRVGVGWIHSSDGTDTENVSEIGRASCRERV